jgi:hypothetical protein
MSPVHDPRFSQARWRKILDDDARQTADRAKWDYLVALGLVVVGLVAYAIQVGVGAGDPVSLTAAVVKWGVLVVGASVVGLLALHIVCSLAGDDAGLLGLAFLRLMAACSITLVVYGFIHNLDRLGIWMTAGALALCIAGLFKWEGRQSLFFAVIMLGLWVGLNLLFALVRRELGL